MIRIKAWLFGLMKSIVLKHRWIANYSRFWNTVLWEEEHVRWLDE